MSRPLMNRLPRGCRTVGGAKARAMERCRRAFMSRFASFGYDPFLPSGLQLIQSAWERLPEGIKDRTVCLTSPFGEPCCLRADLNIPLEFSTPLNAVSGGLLHAPDLLGRPRNAAETHRPGPGRDHPARPSVRRTGPLGQLVTLL